MITEERQEYNREYYRKNKQYWTESYRKNREKVLERCKTRRSLLKQEIFSAYGNRCSCCGETDWRFLTIDHINGGGTKHRKTFSNPDAFYWWLRKQNFPPGYRLLCWNCNCAKGHYGICPHEEARNARVAV